MVTFDTRRGVAIAAGVVLAVASAGAQGLTQPKQGQGGSVVKGTAGTAGSTGDSGLEHCDKPMGALAVVEPPAPVLASLRRYNLASPVGLIRLMIQQSNCFIVVERGAGMQNMMQERALGSAGQLRQDSNVGGGQMVTADFILTPAVVFSENNAGGAGGALGGVFGRRSPVVGAIAGGLKFKEAQTSMLVADARSGVQVAAAEGSTKKADLRLGGALFGGAGGAAAGGYGNTNEGKIIAAAFMDNYNGVARTVSGDPGLQRHVGTLKEEAAAGGATKTGAIFAEGDVLVPKIANVKLLAQPVTASKIVASLTRADELVVVGEVKDGYVNVQSASAMGWVKVVLVSKR
ncbi:MAG TPA: CsgG/HfaB family protein [Vicinamibacterales bacterium]|nr:CsgG/HfaB family protein [Vicinamibacterales bacterium]